MVKFVSRLFLPTTGSRQRTGQSPFTHFYQFYQQQQHQNQYQSNSDGDQYTRSSQQQTRQGDRFAGVEEAEFEVIDEEEESTSHS
ncbi:MAG: hypothetical protein ACQETE_04890 [Bacteroidota bacterium]